MRDLRSSATANARTHYPSAESLGLAQLIHREVVASTMDEAHTLASGGAPAGTLVIADEQTRGRGRSGSSWTSEPGAGLWMTLIERPTDTAALGVLSLRVGMTLANALDAFADAASTPLRLKWPNDLYANDGGKLAGILIEARWREGALDWVAIGVGINLRVVSSEVTMAALRSDVSPAGVLQQVVPAMRAATAARGTLTEAELSQWNARDMARGRRLSLPLQGGCAGITAAGELLVQADDGQLHTIRSGSLVFAT